jgi:hypothetical protein
MVLSRSARATGVLARLKQDLALVEESGGAIAALEGEMVDEGLLQGGKLAVFRMTFDGAD